MVEIGIGVEQEKEAWHLEEMTEDIIAQMQIYELGIDQSLELQWTETGLDVINAESMITLLISALTQSHMIQMVMNQTELHYSLLVLKQKYMTWGTRLFKLIKGKNATTSFLPQTKKGGWVRFDNKIRYIPDKDREYLTEDQARHVYKMVEMDKIINIETTKQEIEDDKK